MSAPRLERAGIEMIEIPRGSYVVGASGVEPYAVRPQYTWLGYPLLHEQQLVEISAPFWISRGLITSRQLGSADTAIAELGYYRALEAAAKLGADLPHWYEWEIAMRGPEPFLYPWGNELDVSKLALETFTYPYPEEIGMGATRGGEEQTLVLLEDFGEYASATSPFGLVDVARAGIEWNREKDAYSTLGIVRSACDVGAMAFMVPAVRPDAPAHGTDRSLVTRAFSGPISACYGVPVRHEIGTTLWDVGAFRLVVR